ncbi:PaeR7I family type II restriction endonuclease [Aeromicrobium duanguangcaii]|uniref:PaeR7I family type II restriction endonuclease n=1 Tax=Aeromicrobium duanguangcaii TaxID=2968086 RepID=UPI0020173743|nr:PaeR7I family type II restriction endonuclease [Aeromicrobium duanguangcaii]
MDVFAEFDTAVRAFWSGRDLQTQAQIQSGRVDAGTRGSVTGGKHLDPIADVIAELFAPIMDMGGEVSLGSPTLPGHYRPSKNWDVVVTHRGVLVAAVECKSQSGSFSNNFNNRVEEAIGNAADIWTLTDRGRFGQVQPWLGFIFILEHSFQSTRLTRDPAPLFAHDIEFEQTSYLDRYRILGHRLMADGLYDAVSVIATERGRGIYSQPDPHTSVEAFAEAIRLRIQYIDHLDVSGALP